MIKGPNSAEVSISVNGVDFFSSGFNFEFLGTSQPKLVTPTKVASSGGVDVVIEGEGFIFTSKLACRFGLVDTVATFLNKTHLRCRVPRLLTGMVSVSVTSNGVDFSDGTLQLEVVEDVLVTAIVPSSGGFAWRDSCCAAWLGLCE